VKALCEVNKPKLFCGDDLLCKPYKKLDILYTTLHRVSIKINIASTSIKVVKLDNLISYVDPNKYKLLICVKTTT